MNSSGRTKICMVAGDPIGNSLSPQMHNAGYKALGIDDRYVYVACEVKPDQVGDFIKGIRAMNVRGVSCTVPLKTLVIPHLDDIDKVAKEIGAVNTIVNNDEGTLTGYNTDWLGALIPLTRKIGLIKNKRIALVGAGGVARAIAYGLTKEKALLSVFNRTLGRAQEIVKIFGGTAYPLNALTSMVKGMDVIVNATSLGLNPETDVFPMNPSMISKGQVVFDAVYSPHGDGKFLEAAGRQGAITISGREMLLHQGMAQFKLFTGYEVPEQVMEETLLQS